MLSKNPSGFSCLARLQLSQLLQQHMTLESANSNQKALLGCVVFLSVTGIDIYNRQQPLLHHAGLGLPKELIASPVPSGMYDVNTHLSSHHLMVCPTICSSHHLHIHTAPPLTSPHHDIIDHMVSLCGRVHPCTKMYVLLFKPRIHYCELVSGTKFQELLSRLINFSHAMSPKHSYPKVTLWIMSANSCINVSQHDEDISLGYPVQDVLQIHRVLPLHTWGAFSVGAYTDTTVMYLFLASLVPPSFHCPAFANLNLTVTICELTASHVSPASLNTVVAIASSAIPLLHS